MRSILIAASAGLVCWAIVAASTTATTASGDIDPALAAATAEAADRRLFARAVRATERGRWDEAAALVRDVKDPLAARYIHWAALVDNEVELAFDTYADFLRDHPSWPLAVRVRARLEQLAGSRQTHEERLQLLTDYPPVTAAGMMVLAEALLATGREAEARSLAREIWRDELLDPASENRLTALFGADLEPADHAARLDRLVWAGRDAAAKRMFGRVDAGRRALASARVALQAAEPGVDGAIARVPRALRDDPGLVFDRMQWRRRKGRDDDVREILRDPPADLGHEQRWWYERAFQIRELLAEGRPESAYELARLHGQVSGGTYAEAQWLAGWLALRAAGRPAEAYRRFTDMYREVTTPISRARAAYWAGRAASVLLDPRAARRWYGLAALHPTTFYGQEAAAEIGVPMSLAVPDRPFSSDGVPAEVDELLHMARLLCSIDEGERAMRFFEEAQILLDDPHPVLHAVAECGRADLLVELGKRAVRAGRIDPAYTFPLPDLPASALAIEDGPPPALVLAVARQESHFDPLVRSGAGALGLMQIMPATGRAMARKLGLPFDEQMLRRDPAFNVTLGRTYLKALAERYDGADYLMAAAYNAGPMRVQRWIEERGDPRRMDRHARLDWLESIPFSETRNYVQRIVEGRRVYDWWLARGGGWKVPIRSPMGPLVPPPTPQAKPVLMAGTPRANGATADN